MMAVKSSILVLLGLFALQASKSYGDTLPLDINAKIVTEKGLILNNTMESSSSTDHQHSSVSNNLNTKGNSDEGSASQTRRKRTSTCNVCNEIKPAIPVGFYTPPPANRITPPLRHTPPLYPSTHRYNTPPVYSTTSKPRGRIEVYPPPPKVYPVPPVYEVIQPDPSTHRYNTPPVYSTTSKPRGRIEVYPPPPKVYPVPPVYEVIRPDLVQQPKNPTINTCPVCGGGTPHRGSPYSSNYGGKK